MRATAVLLMVGVVVVALGGGSAHAAEAACRIAVTRLQMQGIAEGEAHVVKIINETMATEIATATSCQVITEADIASMLDFEAERQACGSDSDSCLAELGDALGVDLITSGTVGKLGDTYTINVRLIDIQRAEVIGRTEDAVDGEPARLRLAARNAGRALFRLPPVGAQPGSAPATQAARAEGSLLPGVMLYAGTGTAAFGLAVALLAGATAGYLFYVPYDPGAAGSLKDLAYSLQVPVAALAGLGGVIALGGMGIAGAGVAWSAFE